MTDAMYCHLCGSMTAEACTCPPMTSERAEDLARRGFQPIDIAVYEPDPDQPPGHIRFVRMRSPREVTRMIRDVLGESPEGGEEGLHPFPFYSCGNCPSDASGFTRCSKYDDRDGFGGHGRNGTERCSVHPDCTGYVDWADCPWPEGRWVVFSVRGGSEGDYVHVECDGKLILLSKTFQGRDASWRFARRVADLLGV